VKFADEQRTRQEPELTRVSMLSLSRAVRAIKRDVGRIHRAIKDGELVPILDGNRFYLAMWQLEEWQRKMVEESRERTDRALKEL
jgi:hypothetical protein